MSNNSGSINWDDVIKREARGSNGFDLGEIQKVLPEDVITQKGFANKTRYAIPKSLALRFDRDCVYFQLSEEGAKIYEQK